MAQNAKVPKFGDWEGTDVPYTQCFDDARRVKNAGRMINPNDPQENPEAFSQDRPSAQDEGEHRRPKHERRASREDSEFHRSTDPSHQRRARRASTGSDRSVEQSPLHHHHQSKSAKGGVSPSALERRASSEAHGVGSRTPVRSRLKNAGRGDETPDKGSTVPEFGGWEKDPNSADGYTGIFDNLRAEKQDGSARVPIVSNDPYQTNDHKRSSQNTGCSCFSWLKK